MTQSTMVGPIIFANSTARKQLRNHGVVVTFRTSERTTGETWWRKSRFGTKEGDVTVEQVAVVDPTVDAELEPYVSLSGFESVGEWQQAIRELHNSIPPEGRLYRVTARDP